MRAARSRLVPRCPSSSGRTRHSPARSSRETASIAGTPCRGRRSGRRSRSSSSVTSPAVGLRKPATALSRVDLPQPDGPMIETNSPGLTWIEASAHRFDRTVDGVVAEAEVADVDVALLGRSRRSAQRHVRLHGMTSGRCRGSARSIRGRGRRCRSCPSAMSGYCTSE